MKLRTLGLRRALSLVLTVALVGAVNTEVVYATEGVAEEKPAITEALADGQAVSELPEATPTEKEAAAKAAPEPQAIAPAGERIQEDLSTRTLLFRSNASGDAVIEGFALKGIDDFYAEVTDSGRKTFLTARNAFTVRMPGCTIDTYTSKEGYIYKFIGWSTWANANLVNGSGSRTLYEAGQEVLWRDVAAGGSGLYAAWSQIGYAPNPTNPTEPSQSQESQSCKAIVFALLKPSAVNAHPGMSSAEGQAGVIPVEPATYSNSYYMRPYAVWRNAKMSELLTYVKRAEMSVDANGVDSLLTDAFWAKLAEQNTRTDIPAGDGPQNIVSPVDGKRYNFFDPNTQRVVWYVIKEQTDGWHIDGIVVDKKNWTLTYSANCPDSNNWLPLGPVMSEGARATVSSVTSSKPQGNKVVEKTLSRPGYEFVGWNTKADGSGIMYQAGDQFANTTGESGHVLYAQWRYKAGTIGLSVSTNNSYGADKLMDVQLSQEAKDAGYELMYSVDQQGKTNEAWTPWSNGATAEEPKKEGPQLDAGDYTVRVKGEKQETHESTEVRSIDVSVEPAKLMVEVPSARKFYDGKPLFATYSLDNMIGLQNDETAGLMVEGEITDIGEVEMQAFVLFAADDNDYTALAQNYDVELNLGTLSVIEAPYKPATPLMPSTPIVIPAVPNLPLDSLVPVVPSDSVAGGTLSVTDPAGNIIPGGFVVPGQTPRVLQYTDFEPEINRDGIHDGMTPAAKGMSATGNGSEEILDEATPLARSGLAGLKGRAWALVNLLCALFSVGACVYEVVRYRRKREEDRAQGRHVAACKRDGREERAERRRSWKVVVASAVVAVAAVVLFCLTEDITLPVALVDVWTLLMVVLALGSAFTLARKYRSRVQEEQTSC